MGDDTALGACAGDAAKAGTLPEHPPERMWGGPGSGAPCRLCGKTVRENEAEFELEFPLEGGAGKANYHVHARCYTAWEAAHRDQGLNGANGLNVSALLQLGNDGIMPDRELSETNQGERG